MIDFHRPESNVSIPFKALVDTGSQLTHLSPKHGRELGTEWTETCEVSGAGLGTNPACPTYLNNLMFHVCDGHPYCVIENVQIVESQTLHAQATLGWNVLRYFSMTFHADGSFELVRDTDLPPGPDVPRW
jgi:hypothetical protein